ncbi:MAG: glycerophosphoryl diester phosphodiesterase membrane domain-containing protein [Propionibacteriaceae bacterium]|jgi:hypothetical protein|nr:glycerophosphoryl diester phosphodiesterase membrane domain-containing protein [Propionibacteriaceae bacterium]
MTFGWPPPPGPSSWEGKVYQPWVPPDALKREWTVPKSDGVVPLRPLTVGDILGGSFRAIRFNVPVMIGLTAAIVLAFELLPAAISVLIGANATFNLQDLEDIDQLLSTLGSLFGLLSLTYVFTFLCAAVVQVFLVHATFEAVTARRPTVAQTWHAALPRVLPVLGYTFLAGLVVVAGLGLVVGLIVAIASAGSGAGAVFGVMFTVLAALGVTLFLSGRLLFAVPAIVVERLGVFPAIRRSWELTHGRFWRTIGLYLLTSLVLSLAASAVSSVVQLVAMPLVIWLDAVAVTIVASSLASLVSSALSLPLLSAAIALIYFDARVRHEGLDIQLAEELWS